MECKTIAKGKILYKLRVAFRSLQSKVINLCNKHQLDDVQRKNKRWSVYIVSESWQCRKRGSSIGEQVINHLEESQRVKCMCIYLLMTKKKKFEKSKWGKWSTFMSFT